MRHVLADLETYVTPLHRCIDCPFCGQTFRYHRRNVAGGALASAAHVRGQLNKHIHEKHPTEVPST